VVIRNAVTSHAVWAASGPGSSNGIMISRLARTSRLEVLRKKDRRLAGMVVGPEDT
jgi:hypothetical protein